MYILEVSEKVKNTMILVFAAVPFVAIVILLHMF